MHCPNCLTQDTKVTDTRLMLNGSQVKRRRKCLSCKSRFTTFEIAEFIIPNVIKRDGSIEPFYEEKIKAGLIKALEKRPISSDKIETSTENIKAKLKGNKDITSREIGNLIMEELKTLDKVAYVRFASVYLSFEDISEFVKMINKLEK